MADDDQVYEKMRVFEAQFLGYLGNALKDPGNAWRDEEKIKTSLSHLRFNADTYIPAAILSIMQGILSVNKPVLPVITAIIPALESLLVVARYLDRGARQLAINKLFTYRTTHGPGSRARTASKSSAIVDDFIRG